MRTPFLISLALLLIPLYAESQGYQKGRTYLGASFIYGIGPGFILGGEASRFEKISLAWDVYVSNFEEDNKKYGLLGFMASPVYHFNQKNPFDPFAQLGLGYFIWNDKKVLNPKYTSGFVLNAQVGLRYFLSEEFAIRTSVGYPYYYASIGIHYQFFDASEYGDE